MNKLDSFENLICWQKAYELNKRLKKDLLSNFPPFENFELTSQILSAARSTTSTIAEGWVRFHYLDSNRFYYISRGSMAEILDHHIEARDDNYSTEQLFQERNDQVFESIKVVNGFIFYLKREFINSLKKNNP